AQDAQHQTVDGRADQVVDALEGALVALGGPAQQVGQVGRGADGVRVTGRALLLVHLPRSPYAGGVLRDRTPPGGPPPPARPARAPKGARATGAPVSPRASARCR